MQKHNVNHSGWKNTLPTPGFISELVAQAKQILAPMLNKKARESALAELISQIEVNVSSTLTLIEQESDGDYSAFFNSFVQTQASKTIENYEVEGTWEDDTEYWVYVRLAKQEYERRLQQKMNIAKSQALKALEDGDEAWDSGDFVQALSLYVRGLSDVAPFIDRPMEVATQAGQLDIFAELRSKVIATVNLFDIIDSSGPSAGQVGRPIDAPFALSVVYKSDGSPAPNVPVSFHFIRGGGDFGDAVFTNSAGLAQGQLRKITAPDNMQIINGGIGYEAFTDGESGAFIRGLLAGANAPTARYILRVAGVPIYLEYSERFLDRKRASNYFQPVLQGELNEAGYTFIDDLNVADLYLEVETNLKKGSETYGIFSAYLEYTLTITNMKTGEEMASYSVTDIKGMSDSYEKAGAKAFEQGLSQLSDEIIPKLIAQIQQ